MTADIEGDVIDGDFYLSMHVMSKLCTLHCRNGRGIIIIFVLSNVFLKIKVQNCLTSYVQALRL